MELAGVAAWGAAIKGLTDAMDKAVNRSVRQAAFLEKKSVRANFGSRPRILTGRLMRSVRYMPITREGYGKYSTTLRASRIYARKTERRYPYFVPGVRRVLPDVQRLFQQNYRDALR